MNTFNIRMPGLLGNAHFRWRHRWQTRVRRIVLAARYAVGRLRTDDARSIVCDCEPVAGWFPLLTLTIDDTIEQALEEYAEHPELRRLVEEACIHVRRKWEPYNDDLHHARCWALEKVREYAAIEGIELQAAAVVVEEPPVNPGVPKDA